MPYTDVKSVSSKLKKGELSSIYYIYGQNVTEVERLTKRIVKAALGDSEEFALNRFEGKYLDFSELYDMVQMMPMMSEYNCILINDYNCEKPRSKYSGRFMPQVRAVHQDMQFRKKR